jgi:hypothetical protein
MKYIMFKKERNGAITHYPVLFPNDLVHSDVAEWLMTGPLEGFSVRSAGFVSSIGKGEGVHGRSDTLGVSSHPDDKDIINGQDYGAAFDFTNA